MLTVLSYLRTDLSPLAPAPNVTEASAISDILRKDTTPEVTDLMAAPLVVLANYRGVLLYCAGGVTIHRYNPTSPGTNGYSSIPSGGVEEVVIIQCSSGRYTGAVRFE